MALASLTVSVALALVGWSDIAIQPSKGDRQGSAFLRNLAAGERPSERTLETLKRFDLDGRARRLDLDAAIKGLKRVVRAQPQPDLVYALAELSWLDGRRQERWHRAAALGRYLDTVGFAYDFLFDPDLAAGRAPSDPRYRLACELYNGGLDRLIRALMASETFLPGDVLTVKTAGREQKLRVFLRESPWSVEDVDGLILASDYEVTGVIAQTYQYGLGVPLIGVHRAETPPRGMDRFYPPEVAFPLTAFLRPSYRLSDPRTASDEARECDLELFDPLRTPTLGEGPDRVRLEADLTTPLGYMWSRTDLAKLRWAGLLRPGQVADRAGLMLLRPYEPGKIPVVMVHGLASSPLAWIPMLNDLLYDPRVQQNYQFLLYLYPTGAPIPIVAAGLRESLRQSGEAFNPGGRDPKFDQMVLLGHSMGGVLSHAMSVQSGDKLWQLSSDRPFSEIAGPPEVLAELKSYLFFEPVPSVRRVVFLATPHRGSDLSRSVVGRVGANLISEPDSVSRLLARLVKENPDAFDSRRFRKAPSSIETLAPDDETLMAFLAMAPAPEVRYHSIIGNIRPGPVGHSTDGVVPYRSSHFPGALTEKLVRSDHGVQKDAEAIREVHRILLEHAGLAASSLAPVTPPASPSPTSAPPTLEPTRP